MATRATITVSDGEESFHIYKHHDGYPEGTLPFIEEAKKFAWELPRFEACEFAAALIREMKEQWWSVYCTKHARLHGDRAYHYEVTCYNWAIDVQILERKFKTID